MGFRSCVCRHTIKGIKLFRPDANLLRSRVKPTEIEWKTDAWSPGQVSRRSSMSKSTATLEIENPKNWAFALTMSTGNGMLAI